MCDRCGMVRFHVNVKLCYIDGEKKYLCTDDDDCFSAGTHGRLLVPPEGRLQLVVFMSDTDAPTRALDTSLADILATPLLPVYVYRAVLIFHYHRGNDHRRLPLPMTFAETMNFLKSSDGCCWADVVYGDLMKSYLSMAEQMSKDYDPTYETKESVLLGADGGRFPPGTIDLVYAEERVRSEVGAVLTSKTQQVPELVDLVCQWWRPSVAKHHAEMLKAVVIAEAKRSTLAASASVTSAFVANERAVASAEAMSEKLERLKYESSERHLQSAADDRASADDDKLLHRRRKQKKAESGKRKRVEPPPPAASASGSGSGRPLPRAKRHKSVTGATTAHAATRRRT